VVGWGGGGGGGGGGAGPGGGNVFTNFGWVLGIPPHRLGDLGGGGAVWGGGGRGAIKLSGWGLLWGGQFPFFLSPFFWCGTQNYR